LEIKRKDSQSKKRNKTLFVEVMLSSIRETVSVEFRLDEVEGASSPVIISSW